MTLRKKIIVWGIIAAIVYVLLSYHFIFFGRTTVRPLKKSRLTLEYTFFSVQGKTNKSILSIDALREDGIADLLIEMGVMTEEEKDTIMELIKEGS